jgi:hypothetical protein
MIQEIDRLDNAARRTPADVIGNRRAFEHHFSPDELAKLWGLSLDTVRRLFEREPGVLVIEHTKNTARRRYRTLRIPDSVASRVHGRRTNSLPYRIDE